MKYEDSDTLNNSVSLKDVNDALAKLRENFKKVMVCVHSFMCVKNGCVRPHTYNIHHVTHTTPWHNTHITHTHITHIN